MTPVVWFALGLVAGLLLAAAVLVGLALYLDYSIG